MEDELKSLRIDRSKKNSTGPSRWAVRWIVTGVLIFLQPDLGTSLVFIAILLVMLTVWGIRLGHWPR